MIARSTTHIRSCRLRDLQIVSKRTSQHIYAQIAHLPEAKAAHRVNHATIVQVLSTHPTSGIYAIYELTIHVRMDGRTFWPVRVSATVAIAIEERLGEMVDATSQAATGPQIDALPSFSCTDRTAAPVPPD